jgi:hypothetical protein
VLSFASDNVNPGPKTFSLVQTESNQDDVLVAVRANDFGGMPDYQGTLVYFRATLTYDPTIVTSNSFKQGDFLKQGGAAASFSVTGGSGRVVIRVDRKDEVVAGAAGSGDVVYIRFKRLRTGNSRVEFADAKAYWGNYHDYLNGTSGGTIHVQ